MSGTRLPGSAVTALVYCPKGGQKPGRHADSRWVPVRVGGALRPVVTRFVTAVVGCGVCGRLEGPLMRAIADRLEWHLSQLTVSLRGIAMSHRETVATDAMV